MDVTEQTHPPFPEDTFHRLNGNFSVPLLTSSFRFNRTSLVAQMVKNLPARPDTEEACVRSLGQEDPQEKEISTHSSILAWKIPWMEKPGRLQSMGSHSRT